MYPGEHVGQITCQCFSNTKKVRASTTLPHFLVGIVIDKVDVEEMKQD